MKPLVLKVTGRVFDSEPELLAKLIHVVRGLSENYRIVIVAGGGGTARRYITSAKSIGVSSNYWLDLIGIWASRLNSLLLISALQPYSYPKPAASLEEALEALASSRIVVMGGLIPGQSTASVAVEVAEALSVSELYYLSAAGYVYDKDPARYPDAKPLKEINASMLKEMLRQKQLPGEYALIDEKALDLAVRSNILIKLVDYREPEKLLEAIRGGNPGSMIHPC